MTQQQNKPKPALTRRGFLKVSLGAGGALILPPWMAKYAHALPIPGGTLDPTLVPKYRTPMLIPPQMPRAGILFQRRTLVDYYEIAVRQFDQQILPEVYDKTRVWGYGPARAVSPLAPMIFNAPSLTIEANAGRPVRVKWINDLVDPATGNYLPHLLPVDPTLHWANPPGGVTERDTRPGFDSTPGPYTGPVPMVTHVHGAVGVGDESDGYAEAWYLPSANNIPGRYATEGTWYEFFRNKAAQKFNVSWGSGYATFQYPNDDRASTNWYHDHTLGMTRLNVYAGPAGFYIIRGGPDGDAAVLDTRYSSTGRRARKVPAILPGPAPSEIDQLLTSRPRTFYEIPIVIQDRSFNEDGSLFYPNTREFFDGIVKDYIGSRGGEFSPIWNPEFFGNTMMVNGNTWPYQQAEQRRYRFRFLNGCQSRFLILDFNLIPGVEVWQIGNEGGFLAAPVNITDNHNNQLLMGLAERADVIVDFTNVRTGDYVLGNVGPDEPFGGGLPDEDFDVADGATTGQVMKFRVVPINGRDYSTPPQFLKLPVISPLPAATVTRSLALIEASGEGEDGNGDPVEGPVEALLGNVEEGVWVAKKWMDPVTENPKVGATEIWEIYNTTVDAHPMHVHEALFEVVNRQALEPDPDDETGETVKEPVNPIGEVLLPEPWETGFKDTVIAYPGQVTRIKLKFNTPGQYVWHCHIVEHEDNEMMRPYRIGPVQPGQPGGA